MDNRSDCRKALTSAFEEVALALGGVVAVYPIPDEAVWDLSRAIDLIHRRACERYGDEDVSEGCDVGETEHPAIVHLLSQLHGRGVDQVEGGVR